MTTCIWYAREIHVNAIVLNILTHGKIRYKRGIILDFLRVGLSLQRTYYVNELSSKHLDIIYSAISWYDVIHARFHKLPQLLSHLEY